MEFKRQSAPHPICGFGYSVNPGSVFAPLIRYALNFSPYKKTSFQFTIPHCISKLALPVTKGVAIEVPERAS